MTEVLHAEADPQFAVGNCSDIHLTTLGRWVVGEAVASGAQDIPLSLIKRHRMNSSRYRLRELDGEQVGMFDRICEASVPLPLKEVKANRADEDTWQNWLAESADDRQLLDYLVWHVATIQEQQRDPGIKQEIADQREKYKEGVRRGLTEGWLHPAAKAAVASVDGVGVYIGDVFGTALKETLAYYSREDGEVILGCATSIPVPGEYPQTRANVRRVIKHEFNHAVLGWLGVRWLNEALTEHIAQVMEHGNLEGIEPNNRLNYAPPAYPGERRLLDFILNEGGEVVPVEMATLAYSEKLSGVFTARNAFSDAVDRAWEHVLPAGEHAFDMLDMYVGRLERRHKLDGLRPHKANEQALAQANHDIRHDPEAVFNNSRIYHGAQVTLVT